jgi:hypothetical protein
MSEILGVGYRTKVPKNGGCFDAWWFFSLCLTRRKRLHNKGSTRDIIAHVIDLLLMQAFTSLQPIQ